MDLSIIIAFKSDNGIREKHLKYVTERYKLMFPDVEIIVSEDKHSKKENKWNDFSKSKYINLGVEKSTKNNLFITDIDMVFNKELILEALLNIERYCFIVPYKILCKINKEETLRILRTPIINTSNIDVKKYSKNTKTCTCGGIHILTKENFYKAGGYDERFVGWGKEDASFNMAVRTICENNFLILDGCGYHLWHPKDPKRRGKCYTENNHAFYSNQYKKALNNKELMEELIKNRYIN